LGRRAGGGAHVEHPSHACDAGGVEAQRLVERRRTLPRVKGGHAERGEVCGSGGSRRWTTAAASSVQGRARDCRLGAGHGEERTQNMPNMFVTLDVSRLSGWLNADAPCRESKEGVRYGARYTGQGGSCGGRPWHTQRAERARLQIGGRARGCGPGRGIHVGGQQAVDDRGARSVQGRARLQIEGGSRGGAHVEHEAHVRDAGGAEAQRLVER